MDCSSRIYQVVELIDAKSIGVAQLICRCEAVQHKAKKGIFCDFRLFLSLFRTASQPYRLSHTNALRINQFNQPKEQSMKFS